MENEKKVSFQLLVLIATPKLADRAAEMFRKGALPLQCRRNSYKRDYGCTWTWKH